jgi:tryptophan synthase beta chain
MNLECGILMREEDTRRQARNAYRMRLVEARVRPVTAGRAARKDAVAVTGPHSFPTIVRAYQAVISREIKEQLPTADYRLPTAV